MSSKAVNPVPRPAKAAEIFDDIELVEFLYETENGGPRVFIAFQRVSSVTGAKGDIERVSYDVSSSRPGGIVRKIINRLETQVGKIHTLRHWENRLLDASTRDEAATKIEELEAAG